MSDQHSVVHLLRHGEVHNPEGVLYGRLPGYRLSERGVQMADMAAQALARHDVAAVIASPMERAQQTAEPIAREHGLTVGTETDLPVRALMSVAIGIGAVYFWVSSKANKRMSMIEEQLPDAVELMVRSLRVGHPFSNAISSGEPDCRPCRAVSVRTKLPASRSEAWVPVSSQA